MDSYDVYAAWFRGPKHRIMCARDRSEERVEILYSAYKKSHCLLTNARTEEEVEHFPDYYKLILDELED